MELIGIPACACTHSSYTTSKFFLLIIHACSKSVCILCDPEKRSCFRPQAIDNFQLDRKLQSRTFLATNDAVSTRWRQEYLPPQ